MRRCAAAAVGGTLAALMLWSATGCSARQQPHPIPMPTSAPAATPIDAVGQPEVSSSQYRSELVAEIEVLPTASGDGKRVLFSRQVEVGAGQVVLALAEFQVTNQIDRNVFVASQVVLSDRPDGVSGQPITPANGQNVTPDMHHGQQTKAGSVAADAGRAGVRYVNLVVWAAMTTAEPGDRLRIDRGYGRLTVMVW